jgi:hypothetical protein
MKRSSFLTVLEARNSSIKLLAFGAGLLVGSSSGGRWKGNRGQDRESREGANPFFFHFYTVNYN